MAIEFGYQLSSVNSQGENSVSWGALHNSYLISGCSLANTMTQDEKMTGACRAECWVLVCVMSAVLYEMIFQAMK